MSGGLNKPCVISNNLLLIVIMNLFLKISQHTRMNMIVTMQWQLHTNYRLKIDQLTKECLKSMCITNAHAERKVFTWMAGRLPRTRFHQPLCQSSHLRRTLRGVQVVVEEDAEEGQHRCTNGTHGYLIRVYRVHRKRNIFKTLRLVYTLWSKSRQYIFDCNSG